MVGPKGFPGPILGEYMNSLSLTLSVESNLVLNVIADTDM